MFKIMGIINVDDDSFYSASRAMTPEEISTRLHTLTSEGADIIDFGACSTRPGSIPIDQEEEWKRLHSAITIFKELYPSHPFSVDTFRSSVVKRCFREFGSFIVNDISAGEDDPEMLKCVGESGLKYIAMHKRGTPSTMQSLCQYDDVTEEILRYFRDFSRKAEQAGIEEWILDPGFGFAKTIDQNYELMDNLERFHELGKEILVGISRKSFIYKKLGITPEEALPATTALHRKAIGKGAGILRVHDVAAANALRVEMADTTGITPVASENFQTASK